MSLSPPNPGLGRTDSDSTGATMSIATDNIANERRPGNAKDGCYGIGMSVPLGKKRLDELRRAGANSTVTQ